MEILYGNNVLKYNKNRILLLGIIIDNIIAILFLIPNHQTKWVFLRKTMS
jgi:hypothetical protein